MTTRAKSGDATSPKERKRRETPRFPSLRDVEIHRIFGDNEHMMKVEWNEDGTSAVRQPVSMVEAAALMARKHPSFCMDNYERPGWKYYYYYVNDGWASRDVPVGDPLCLGI